MKVIATRVYERAVTKLLSVEERERMEDTIAADPQAAPVVPGTGGIRKLRWSRPGMGKRGGLRTLYFFHAGPTEIYMLTIYAKSAREDLSPADRKAWARLVDEIRKAGRSKP